MIQDIVIVIIEGEKETAPKLSNGTSFNNLEWPLIQISRSCYYSTPTRKWYKIELYLQSLSNRKSYMIYRTAPFSMATRPSVPPNFKAVVALLLISGEQQLLFIYYIKSYSRYNKEN